VKLINKTRWRTDHLRAIIVIGLREEGVPAVRMERLTVWVMRGRPGVLKSWGFPKRNQIIITLPPPTSMPVTARMVGGLTLNAAAELLEQSHSDGSAWRTETLPLMLRSTRAAPPTPTADQRRMARFKKAAALAAKWKRALKHATVMHRKWSRRAARMHKALNQGMAGRPRP